MESLLLVLLPLVFGILTVLVGKGLAKQTALAGALASFGLFAYMLSQFAPVADSQFVLSLPWMRDFGIQFALGLDGISLIPVLLTAVLVPLILVVAGGTDYKRTEVFHALILFMQSGLYLVFLAKSALTFYLGWEAALIPVFFLSGVWGGENRLRATIKFVVYTLFGSLCMLIGLAFIYFQTSGTFTGLSDSWADMVAVGNSLEVETQSWLFWAIFIAFAIKMPLFPFHTWQPDVYVQSPTPATMLLSGIMLKMGVYGVLRWLLPVLPMGVEHWAPTVIVLSIIGVIYGSVIAIKQSDIKRLVAYSSFAHVGLMCAGMFTLTTQGVEGAIIQMFSHGLTVLGLFLAVDVISKSTGERNLEYLGGLTQYSPAFSVYFVLMLLGSVALPLTSGFVGEFLLLQGIAEYNIWIALAAGGTVIFSAVYMLRMFQGIMLGPKPDGLSPLIPLTLGDNVVFITLAVLIFWLGLFPAPFIDLIKPSVAYLIQTAGR